MTFDYTRPLSNLREQYLVNYLDKVELADMLKTKALIIANLLASSNTAKEANKECNDIFRIIGGLLLPTELKVDTMNNMSKEDRKKLGDTLRAATAAAAKKATSSNKPKKSKQ